MNPTRDAAIRAAQGILQRTVPSLTIDGWWGNFTHSAYERAPGEEKTMIDGILASRGFTAEKLIAENRAAKAAGRPEYLEAKGRARAERSAAASSTASPEVRQAIERAARDTGVDLNTLMGFVKIESNFKADAINGSSRGLTQMQPGAWKDALKVDSAIGSYDKNVFDPYLNARAGARYLQINTDQLKRSGYSGPLTPAVLYLAHQQGAAGFVELWLASQGMVPRTNHVSANKMKLNPPQDGKGITLDRAEFYRRWLAVAESKIGT